MKVFLIIVTVTSGTPDYSYIEQPSLATCWAKAKSMVPSRVQPKFGAGCGVVRG